MNIEDLANQELELLNQTLELVGTVEEKNDKVVYFGIGTKYQKIHEEYSRLAKSELEALKRGLFIMWYAFTEPSCYTGIVILNSEAENRLLKILDRRLKRDITDYELDWMLDYYSSWDLVFERFSEFKYLQDRLRRNEKIDLPNQIDRIEMSQRGQMCRYWNSLSRFQE